MAALGWGRPRAVVGGDTTLGWRKDGEERCAAGDEEGVGGAGRTTQIYVGKKCGDGSKNGEEGKV